MLKAPLKIFYFLNLVLLILMSDAGFKASLTLAEIAPTTKPNETPSTQKKPQPQKDQITPTSTIVPGKYPTRASPKE